MVIECTTCGKEKPESDFSIFHGRRNKQCKKCREYHNSRWELNPDRYREKRVEYNKLHKQRNREKNFRNIIRAKYNLSVEEYDRMLKDQLNRCAICEIEFVLDGSKSNLNRLPCIDHCHRTNKVRGLLCRKCNLSLAYIESGLYEKAQEYLRVNEAKDKEPS
jgi:hypothetical protein